MMVLASAAMSIIVKVLSVICFDYLTDLLRHVYSSFCSTQSAMGCDGESLACLSGPSWTRSRFVAASA